MGRYRTRYKSRSSKWAARSLIGAVVVLGWWSMARLRAEYQRDVEQFSGAPAKTVVMTMPASAPAAQVQDLFENDNVIDITSPAERREHIDDLLTRAEDAFNAGRYIESRTHKNAALAMLGEEEPARTLREELAAMNTGLLLGTDVLPGDHYEAAITLADGDTFPKIAARYRVPAALLRNVNPGLDPKKMRAGTTIKAIAGPFHLTYIKQAERLDLYARDLYVRSFSARIEQAFAVPVGDYRVKTGGKVQVATPAGAGGKCWIGVTGTKGSGWLYGSAGPRDAGGTGGRKAGIGILVSDEDLQTLYNVLVEGDSQLHVEP